MSEFIEDSLLNLDDPHWLISDTNAQAIYEKTLPEREKVDWMELTFNGETFYLERSACEEKVKIENASPKKVPVWILDQNPYQWHFIPENVGVNPYPLEEDWNFFYMIRVFGQWAESCLDCHIAAMYKGLYLMLLFNHATLTIAEKNAHRPALEFFLKTLEPHLDLIEADLTFCRKIYRYSPIARRAKDENHLWLILQFSGFLEQMNPTKQSKTQVRKGNSDCCRIVLESLDRILKQDYPKIKVLLPEDYLNLQLDWRFNVRDILIATTLNILKEKPNDGLKHSFKQWIESIRHWNRIVGYQKGYDTLKPPKSTKTKKRRGRPPKFM